MARVVRSAHPDTGGTPRAPGPVSPRAAALAAELHDGVSQHLFAAELDLHDLLGRDLDPVVREVVERIGRHVEAGSRELRTALFGMVATSAAEAPGRAGPGLLTARIADLVSMFRDRHGLAVSLHLDGEGDGAEPAPDAARVLYRTAREGLTNVVKHANGGRALVALSRGRASWTVEVHDSGDGNPETVARHAVEARSFGLFSLLNDATRVGGRLRFGASPELSGLQLCVSVPAGDAPAPGGRSGS